MINFNTVSNQKIIVIHRDMPTKENNFLAIKKDHLINAYKDLKHTAFSLYIFLMCNKDNYSKAFSPQAILNEFGMPIATTHDQINKLIAKGYLVQRDSDSNTYDLYETPQQISN